MSRKTAKQLWEESEEGAMFACRFIPSGGEDIDDSPEVIWEKGVVDNLAWDSVLWITPIEFTGERAYR